MGVYTEIEKSWLLEGGDSALEEALFLCKFSDDITLVHRRDKFRASKVLQNRVLKNPRIKILYNTTITALNGSTDVLESVDVYNSETHTSTTLEVNGLFYGLGLTPNSGLVKDLVTMDDKGYIKNRQYPDYETMTLLRGMFVAGDVADSVYRQAIVSAGDGCKAAMDVDRYLSECFA